MFKSLIDNISKEDLEKIVSKSSSINEVAKKLGYIHSPGLKTRNKIKNTIEMYSLILGSNIEKKQKNIEKKSKLNINNTNVIGGIGETSFQLNALMNNIPVSKPVVDTYPYDFIIEINDKLFKIQVKTAAVSTEKSVTFNLRNTVLVNGKFRHTSYSIKDCDYFYLYDPFKNIGFLLRNNGNMNSFTIRYENNNCQSSHYYEDYLFETIINNMAGKCNGCIQAS